MVTQILNSDPNAVTKAVRVERSPALSQLLPSVAVGDLVNFTVRQNPKDGGQGLISFRGNSIKANLPSHLNAGDRVSSQIEGSGDQIIFRILGLEKASMPTMLTRTASVQNQLEQLVLGPKGSALKMPASFALTDLFEGMELPKGQMQQLATVLGSMEQLADPQAAFKHVMHAANGQLAASIKESVAALRELTQALNLGPEQRIALAFKESLSQFISQFDGASPELIKDLSKSVEILLREVKNTKDLPERSKVIFQEIARSLNEAASNPEQLMERMEGAIRQLNSSILQDASATKIKDPQLLGRFQEAAVRLEQMAITQEVLNQLNPVMQAMGEPALLLFPFIFQGLISHSQVTLEPRQKLNPDGKGRKGSTGGETFQRIQVSVPLPTLGVTGVDIAHRPGEMLVRFSMMDEPSREFIEHKMGLLVAPLREQGFENVEFSTVVGSAGPEDPAWTEQLSKRKGIVA